MRMGFTNRIKKLQKLMLNGKVNKLLVTDRNDIYYYTGYRMLGDDAGFFVIDPAPKPKLFVSPLSNEAEKLKGIDVFTIRKMKSLANILKPGWVGYDEHGLNSYLFLKLKKLGVRLKPESGLIKEPREIKEAWEIEQIKNAIKITKKVIENIDIKNIIGKSETQVAKDVGSELIRLGADNSFETIVSSGRDSYFIHHVPGKRKIKRGDLVIIDLGARFNSYCSDITRTLCLNPGKEERSLISDVRELQGEILEKIRNGIRDGIRFEEVLGFYKKIMRSRKYEVFHGFGHGVGLSVHEMIKGKLKQGMVLTVEPGVYIRNLGGCRIEDMILIKKNGIKVLSGSIR